MHFFKALIGVLLTTHALSITTGAEDADVTRHFTKSDDIANHQWTSKALTIKSQILFRKFKHGIYTTKTNRRVRRSLYKINNVYGFNNGTRTIGKHKIHKHEWNPNIKPMRRNTLPGKTRSRFGEKTIIDNEQENTVIGRKRRYTYDDNGDWQYDEKFDYDDDSEETKKWKKYAKNWDKIGLRLIYIGSTIVMISCCCCLCCRKCCKIMCDTCNHFVMTCVDRCRCRDPMYRKIKSLSDRLGIQLDYDTYQNLKRGYTEDLATQGFKVNI